MASDRDDNPWGNNAGDKNQNTNRRPGKPPENLEELFEDLKKKFTGSGGPFQGGSSGGGNPTPFVFSTKWMLISASALALVWLSSGFYRVGYDEQAVILRFGALNRTATSGLNYHLPAPIESALVQKVTTINRIDSAVEVDNEDETLMLTGDENIADVHYTVLWFIKDLGHYLFSARHPEETVRAIAESAVREAIAQTKIAYALAEGRASLNTKIQALVQKVMDEYKLGIQIQEVQLQRVDPPKSVIDSYRDVQRAKADQEKMRNQADAYRNSLLPEARGQAQQIIQEAEGYKQRVIAEAQGEAAKFSAIYAQYITAPELTRKRLTIETMESILKKAPKRIIDPALGHALPVLPINMDPSIKAQPTAASDVKGSTDESK